ncbi:MAG: nitrogenase stabilizing/protective protein NifW [Thiomonas sp.]|uniref:nitrogenase stabilizing/protective protein NifW n=1 Tax=Thiomonas sp. TaxID=2047785 RepID=UPI002A371945|nr:nitrogenase stabilizing/protective protein NifW [Thiomonas sp.]MDY0329785.1 nitrogenase stabilizing/protective protein NifW [Thiomonas sp.]
MNDLIIRLKQLSSAEEFLQFFGVSYDEHVVHVNRLHILKRFYQYLHKAQGLADLNEVEMFTRYRELLAQAYQDFVHSSAVQEKVFKVFQDAEGQQRVSLTSLRDRLAQRRSDSASPAKQAA